MESPRNKKRQKTEPEEEEEEEEEDEGRSSRRWCGICLVEEGKKIRGELDSCDHYFCFVCIMEWAKVETRCPFCKQRFTTIRRPPFPGIFPSPRLIHVPHRNQMSYLSWVTAVGPFDPYEQVRCRVCMSSGDDYLLLLCDLCDSAAHTYCIGLGVTVPDRDWFCNDCSIIRAEFNDNQRDRVVEDDDHDDVVDVFGSAKESLIGNSDVVRSEEGVLVSIREIVHESDVLMLGLSHNASSLNLNGVNVDGRSDLAPLAENSEEISSGVVNEANRTEARRTLNRRSRNVGSYIRSLRENWDALRFRSLSFSSFYAESTSSSGGNHGNAAVPHDSSGKPCILSSAKNQPQTTWSSLHGSATHASSSYDIDKAWKMLDRAKSARRTRESAKRVQKASKYFAVNQNTLQESTDRLQTPPFVPSHSLGSEELVNKKFKKHHDHYVPGKEREKYISRRLEKQQLIGDELINCAHAAFSPAWMEKTKRKEIFNESKMGILQKNMPGYSLAVNDEPNSSASSITSGGVSGASNLYKDRSDCGTSSYLSSVNLSKQSNASARDCIKGKAKKDDDAKREIQSIVKLNLKLLSKDEQLGLRAFKEIARLATHTILAACGLEHSKSAGYSCSRPVCHHSEQEQQLYKSEVMPNYCQECFFVFVKDVVSLILSEKLCHFKLLKSSHLA